MRWLGGGNRGFNYRLCGAVFYGGLVYFQAHEGVGEEGRLVLSTIRGLMERYGERYWLSIDLEGRYPHEFLREYLGLGFGGLMIPEEYGGMGMGARELALVAEEMSARGGTSYHVRGMYYPIAVIAKYGSRDLKSRYLPQIARGEARLLAFAVTEPEAGSDTASISTLARRASGRYIIRGRKIFISRFEQSDLMLLVARTRPLESVSKRTEGITLFLVDLREARGGIESREIKVMALGPVYELYINDLEVPEENVIGNEGEGFKYLLSALNVERIVIASDLVGSARWFIEKSSEYASSRRVFGRPIGSYQGVQFPIASSYIKTLAADEITHRAAQLYDSNAQDKILGLYSNTAKYLAAEAAWEAANVAMDTFGGYGYAKETNIERKFREVRLYRIAPVTQNLILAFIAHNVLGLPRSY